MTIVLVRHGETAGNAGLILQRAEIPLNERGIQQAARLADRLAALECVHILCSDLARARMTAQPLSERTGLAVEESPLLQERNFGDLRGTPYAELHENPFGPSFAPPNGEDWAMFHARVAQACELIVARRRALSGTLVVVTHGLVCRALIERHIAPLHAATAPVPERFDNTSVSILDADHPHTIRLLNCTQHLLDSTAKARLGGAV